MNARRFAATAIATVSLAAGIAIGTNGTYNPETTGLWIGGYGVELAGREFHDGVALVNCYQVPSLPGFTTVDC